MRTSPQRNEEKARVRTELLRASLSLAAQHGFTSLGLREVAREAGIAPTSFYRHFADMKELGLALVDEMVQPMLQAVEQSARKAFEEGADVATALMDEMHAATDRDPQLVRFMLSERYGPTVSFRRQLRKAIARLATSLISESREQVPLGVVEAVVAVLLDSCDAQLDSDGGAQQASRDAALNALRWLLRQTGGRGTST